MKCSLNYQKCILYFSCVFHTCLMQVHTSSSTLSYMDGHKRSGPKLAVTADPWLPYPPHPPVQTVHICHEFQQLHLLILRDEGRAVGEGAPLNSTVGFQASVMIQIKVEGKYLLKRMTLRRSPCTGVWDGRAWRREALGLAQGLVIY